MRESSTPEVAMYDLTPREREILRLITEGLTDMEIALALRVSPYTVNKDVSCILKKLSVHTRTQAAIKAVKEGIVA